MKPEIENNAIDASVELARRKAIGRAHLRSLSLSEKIAKLVDLQHHYYSMLQLREKNGGRSIPDRWRKWKLARSRP